MDNVPKRYLNRLDTSRDIINFLNLDKNENQYINEQVYSEYSVRSRMKSSDYLPDQRTTIQL